MLKKYYKYISVNLLALAGFTTAYPWWHMFFIRPEFIRNDALNHSMENAELWVEIDFFYFICLSLLINLAIIFFIEKQLRKNKEFQVISTSEKLHFGIAFYFNYPVNNI